MRARSARRTIPFGAAESHTLLTLARMPYASEQEVAIVLRMNASRARTAIAALSALGYIEGVQCGGEWRHALTDKGIWRAAMLISSHTKGETLKEVVRQNLVSQDDLDNVLTRFPVSLQWRRSIMERMGALRTLYRLTALAAEASGERLWFSWRRTDWLDGTIMLRGGRGIRIMRVGATLRRRSLLYRLGGMAESSAARGLSAVIAIVPSMAESRIVEQWIAQNTLGVRLFVALEGEILGDGAQSLRLLRPIKGDQAVFNIETLTLHYQQRMWTLGQVISSLKARGSSEARALDSVESGKTETLPGNRDPRRRSAELLSWMQLNTRALSALRLVSDWPLGFRWQLVELGASRKALSLLHRLGLVYYAWEGRYARCVLSDAGARHLTSTDRSSLAAWRKRWSFSTTAGGTGYKLTGGDLPPEARFSAEGGSMRKNIKELRHQDQSLEICATLGRGWPGAEVIEILPAHRSERWAKFRQHSRSIKPDSLITARVAGGRKETFSVEYEQRAETPKMMNDKILPYETYYRNVERFEGSLGVCVKTLFLFPDEAHASRFAKHCLSIREQWTRYLEIYVSSMPQLREGLTGDIWLAGGGYQRGRRVSLEQIVAS